VLTYRCLRGSAPSCLAETSTQLPAVQPVTSDLPTRLHYWSRRHDAQHWATAPSRRLQQEPGTLCLLVSGMRLLWSPSVKNWKLCCLGSVSLWIDSRTRFVFLLNSCGHIYCDCYLVCETRQWHCKVVLQQQCDSATIIIFISATNAGSAAEAAATRKATKYAVLERTVVELVECGKESVYDIWYTGERQGGYKQTHIV